MILLLLGVIRHQFILQMQEMITSMFSMDIGMCQPIVELRVVHGAYNFSENYG